MTGRLLLTLLLACALPTPLFPAQLSSCKVFKSSSSVLLDLFFDGAFAVKGVVYNHQRLLMPFDAYRDRRYDNVRLLSKSIYISAEKAAIEGGCQENRIYKKPELRILQIDHLKSSGRLANVSITISEDFNVLAGVIKNKKGGIWVSWPAGFAFLKKEDRAYADRLILSSYKNSK